MPSARSRGCDPGATLARPLVRPLARPCHDAAPDRSPGPTARASLMVNELSDPNGGRSRARPPGTPTTPARELREPSRYRLTWPRRRSRTATREHSTDRRRVVAVTRRSVAIPDHDARCRCTVVVEQFVTTTSLHDPDDECVAGSRCGRSAGLTTRSPRGHMGDRTGPRGSTLPSPSAWFRTQPRIRCSSPRVVKRRCFDTQRDRSSMTNTESGCKSPRSVCAGCHVGRLRHASSGNGSRPLPTTGSASTPSHPCTAVA